MSSPVGMPPMRGRGGGAGSVQGENQRPSRPGSALSMASGYGAPPPPPPGANYAQTGAYGHPMMYPYNHYGYHHQPPPPMYGHHAYGVPPMGPHDPYMPPHMRYLYICEKNELRALIKF